MISWGVELRNVTATWRKNDESVLENINLTVEVSNATYLLPLMGPSGQGKSTLLYLMASLKWPSQGEIIWKFPDGKSFRWGRQGVEIASGYSIPMLELRRDYFGFAFQSSTLSSYMTVIENIAYPLSLQGKAWDIALSIAEVTLNEVLLSSEKENEKKRCSLMQSFPSQLSGGQRQRVALAQAMVHDPYVLFADEPTGQLDLPTRRQVMNVLKRWVEKQKGKRCLIWVTHHHLDDLDLMDTNDLIFVDNQGCIKQKRKDLEKWIA